jgi:hypothetical protein
MIGKHSPAAKDGALMAWFSGFPRRKTCCFKN